MTDRKTVEARLADVEAALEALLRTEPATSIPATDDTAFRIGLLLDCLTWALISFAVALVLRMVLA